MLLPNPYYVCLCQWLIKRFLQVYPIMKALGQLLLLRAGVVIVTVNNDLIYDNKYFFKWQTKFKTAIITT